MMTFPTKCWYSDEPMTLTFPEGWRITELKMPGHNAPPLSDESIKSALDSPIGSKKIRDIAHGKKEAVILFDDTVRPTPTSRIAPFVIEELHEGGIKDDDIRFVGATGTHRPMIREDFVKKLGEELINEYDVFTHNPFYGLIEVGTTSRGTPAKVNREVMSCDIKIGIGCLLVQGQAGWGGGAKIILPGVSSKETIWHNHCEVGGFMPGKTRPANVGPGHVKGNILREDIEETARLAGLDFKIDTVINNKREVIGLFTGDFVDEHRVGVKYAKTIYNVKQPKNMDIVITNAYPLEDEAGKSRWTFESVKKGGDVVWIVQTPEGQVSGCGVHYTHGRWGTDYGAKGWFGLPKNIPIPRAKRLIILSEYPSKRDMEALAPKKMWGDKLIWVKTWPEALELLKQDYHESARVAVYPYGTLECPPFPDDWV